MHAARGLVVALALAIGAAAARGADRLPAFGAEPDTVTVSGVSSGGYMAGQLHVAHSGAIKGVGVLAAGPYYCAQGSVITAYYNCMAPGAWTPLPALERLKRAAGGFAQARAIDPTANLADARVWLFSGTNDRTVDRSVVDGLRAFYLGFGVPPGRLAFVADRPAGHAMITAAAGSACAVTGPPFINDCDFDAAGALLAHLLGPLEPPAARESGRFVRFDQKPFAGGDAYSISMADSGYAYVPRACEADRCRVHVAFHGCRQSAEAIGERFVREAGYNRWADANRLIVLYPQAIGRDGWGMAGLRWSFVFNPRGCWDWWGYTGAQYATKAGPQVAAVKAMIDRLAAPRP
jgi:poly(3-hydroxybutyrate) depolymerase